MRLEELEKKEEIVRLNITDQVYEIIKERIKNRSLKAGAHLVERKLAKELSVSKTPVREAMARLEKDDLVVRSSRGMCVRLITRKEVEDILQIRMMLEGFALELIAGEPKEELVKELTKIQKRCLEALEKEDLDDYKKYDDLFHNTIHQSTGNQELLKIIQGLRDRIYIVMSTSVKAPGRAKVSFQEHQSILQAIKEGDANKAIHRGREHIHRVWEIMEKEWQQSKEEPI